MRWKKCEKFAFTFSLELAVSSLGSAAAAAAGYLSRNDAEWVPLLVQAPPFCARKGRKKSATAENVESVSLCESRPRPLLRVNRIKRIINAFWGESERR